MQTPRVLLLVFVVVVATAARTAGQDVISIPAASIGSTCRVLGQTGEPMGTMVTVDGVVVEGGRCKGDSSEPVLQVRKINGRASQECIEIHIRPYATDFGEPYFVTRPDASKPRKPDPERSLPELEFGKTYEFRGYETGRFEGDPDEAAFDGGIVKQRGGFYFRSVLVVVKGKKVPPIAFCPADFLGQKVIVHGRATLRNGRARLTGDGWEIEVLGRDVWPSSLVNARVAVTGLIGKGPGAELLHITNDRVCRDHLEDQIGQRVALRGRAADSNWRWYLWYNGEEMLVENMDHLAAEGSLELHTAVEVRGVLHKERLRDEIFGERSDEPEERYIVREASCTRVEDLLPIEIMGEPCPWSIGATPPDPGTPREQP
jgi:hypothetical protein